MASIGWVKLHRSCIEGGWLTNHKLWTMWTYCLLKATHKKGTRMVGYQKVLLEPGQFVFGRKVASEETGLSEQSIRTTLKHLKKLGNLTIKPTNKYSIVTICNWERYQVENNESNQQVNEQVTSTQPASNQHLTTDKNDKNSKNDKNVKKIRREKQVFVPPSVQDVISYFKEKGFSEELAIRAFEYYEAGDWKDSQGTPVRSWKQKMIANWMKNKNKAGGDGNGLSGHSEAYERLIEKHKGVL